MLCDYFILGFLHLNRFTLLVWRLRAAVFWSFIWCWCLHVKVWNTIKPGRFREVVALGILVNDHFPSPITIVGTFHKRPCLIPIGGTSRKRPPPISDHFSKVPKLSQSNHYSWNLSYAGTSHKRPLSQSTKTFPVKSLQWEPLVSDHFPKVPKFSQSNHYSWHLS